MLALADKITTIAAMFEKGMVPTGSKDPFALRRAGAGVIRILAENEAVRNQLHLASVLKAAVAGREGDGELPWQLKEFMLDRLEFYLQESCGVRLHVARAVRNSRAAERDTEKGERIGYGSIAGFAKALEQQVGSGHVIAVAELLKRTSNILRQAREKKISYAAAESGGLLKEPAEIELARRVSAADAEIQKNYRAGEYAAVIAAIAGLQLPLNAFFDSVMVMVEDSRLRDNRLALLARTEATVRWAADFSELASI